MSLHKFFVIKSEGGFYRVLTIVIFNIAFSPISDNFKTTPRFVNLTSNFCSFFIHTELSITDLISDL
jgi:hypothetical protein